MKSIYKILLTLNATSPMVFVYLVQGECWIPYIGAYTIFVYIVAMLLFTKICIWLQWIPQESSIEAGISEISIATDGYMSVFMGYFFVALGIPKEDWRTFITVYIIINIFTWNSQTIYFNPLLYLWGYNFYELHTLKGTRVYVITKEKDIKGTEGLEFRALRKINEYTYMEENNGLFICKSKGQKKSL